MCPREEEPTVGLAFDDLGKLHRSGEHYHRHQRQSDRQFVTDHLRATSHRADQRIFVVTRPTGQQDADDPDRRHRHQKKDPDVEIEHFETFGERQAAECQHRRNNHDVRREVEQETVDMVDRDQLLDQHLDHVGYALHGSVRPHPVRPEAALEKGTDFAFDVDQRQRDHRITEQQAQADQHALGERHAPGRHHPAQRIVHPSGHRVEINTVCICIQ